MTNISVSFAFLIVAVCGFHSWEILTSQNDSDNKFLFTERDCEEMALLSQMVKFISETM